MIASILGTLWSLLKLPVTLVLLPFRILSALVSLVVYGTVLLVLGLLVFVFVL